MNILTRALSVLVLGALCVTTHAAGLLKPVNSAWADLEIKQHHVNVSVDGTFITTSIEQIFFNPNDKALEAIYSFPVPEHAAVGEFTYWIDDQPVVGEVVEKQRAREIYEQEKSAGREAAIAEKEEYRTFDIRVTPVLPKQEVKIRLSYVQNAYVDTSIGRYVYPLEDGGTDEQKNAFWHRNEAVSESFSFNLYLRSGYPVDALRLPKHSGAKIEKVSEQEWKVSFVNQAQMAIEENEIINININESGIEEDKINDGRSYSPNVNTKETGPSNVTALDKDIVVYWRLKQNLPAGMDLITYKEGKNKQGTFLLTLTPGDDIARIEQGRDWVFVLDVSGSMSGKYASLVDGVQQAINRLPPQDRFKVIVFNDQAHDLSHGYRGVHLNEVDEILQRVASYTPNGGTNLYAGIDSALKQLNTDRPSGIVLVTDGVANVGVTEKKKFMKLVSKHDIRLFTFIMGNSANRPLLEEMTDISEGFSLSISNSDDIAGKVMQAASKLSYHAMRDIDIKLSGVKTANIISNSNTSIYRGQQIVVAGHYFGSGELKVEMDANIAGSERRYNTTLTLPEKNVDSPEIERLWAYAHIQNLKKKISYLGEDADSRQSIVDTAVHYGLVTDYTSMIVLREEVFAAYDIARQNNKRVEKEYLAKQVRTIEHVRKQVVKEEAPMFTERRPTLGSGSGGSGSGGGALSWPFIVLLLFFVFRISGARKNV